MRFVKGDAVAAILIVGINLVGGLVIGIGSRGMSAAEAMRTYSLLSIGEGLVAQIPSLLVAVAAGLLVTRVASAGDGGLGEDLATQLTGQPRALGAAAVLLLGLGLVPGLPLAPFALLGGVAALAAWALRVRPSTTLELDEPGADRRGDARGGRLALVVSAALAARLAPRRAALHEALAALRAGLTTRTGVALPPLTIVVGPTAGDDELAVHLDGVAVAWLALGDDPVATLAAELPAALAPLAPELLGLDRVAALVDQAARHAPVLVREVVPKVIALPALAEVLRGLAREQVPLDDLTAILEAIATLPAPAGGHAARDAAALVEQLRSQLRRQISARWAPRGQLEVFTVDAMIEDAVRTAIERRDGGAILALEPAIAQDIVAAIRARTGDRPAVILASADIRRHLRGLLEPELPAIAVLSAHELAPGTLVTTAGRIDVG
jgi:type III secretion protein V